MSDIEIIEIENKGIGRKRNLRSKVEEKKQQNVKKRKRSLIEDSKTMKGTETQFKDFVLDRTEAPNCGSVEDVEDNVFEVGKASAWSEELQKSLLGQTPTEPPKKWGRRKNVCYNCDGEHNLADCKTPRDFRRISQKRREQADEIRRRQLSYARYTDEQTTKNFRPGKISKELRAALGIFEHDIPEYIYRMRRMGFVKGYPPGYLKKAIKNSDENALLTIIEIDSKNKIDEKTSEKAPLLEPDKMICYMGFNGTYKKLRDLEKFNIPPIDVFCDKYQEELQILFKKEQKKKKQTEKKHKKFDNDDDDDVVIIEAETNSSKNCDLPGEEREKVVLAKNDRMDFDESVDEGESMLISIGTPVVPRKTTVLPSIDAFKVGIIPFEAKEELSDNKGIFKRLMTKLRSK